MRIERLHLLAFGPFRGRTLDFSKPGLHVVFGPNEAGKSTTLRAIANLLYGIEVQTPDAHTHKPTELRIGGELAADDGERIHVVRRKSTPKAGPKSLLDVEGLPVSDQALVKMMRGMPEETFRQAFGLHHTTLTQGAEALLKGKGALGESLFDASVGGGGEVYRVRGELEAAASELYKPQGKTPLLNKALHAFEAARDDIRKLQTLPEAYRAKEVAVEQAEAERRAVVERRRGLIARRAEIERACKRAPLERRRIELTSRMSGLGEVGHHRVRVASLPTELASYEHAVAAREGCHKELDALAGKLADARRRAGVAPEAEVTPALSVDARTQARIERCVTDRAKVQQKIASSREELLRDEHDLARLRATPLPPAWEPSARAALATSLAVAQALGDAERRHADGMRKVASTREQLSAEVLSLVQGEHVALERFATLSVPPRQAIAEVSQRAVEIERKLAHREQRRDELTGRVHGVDLEIARQTGGFAPPDADALSAVRRARDEAWSRLQASTEATRASLSSEFERALRDADAVVDTMLDDALRVHALATLRAERGALGEQLAAVDAELVAIAVERRRCDEAHAALWRDAVVAPGSFTEMLAWLDRRDKALAEYRKLREDERALEELSRGIAEARDGLVRALLATDGATAEAAAEGLGHCVQIAHAHLERMAHDERAAKELEVAIAKQERSIGQRRASLRDDEAELHSITARLTELTLPLGLPEDASAEEIHASLKALFELATLEDRRRALAASLAEHAATTSAFEARVAGLCAELAPDLVGAPARSAAEALASRGREAEGLFADLRENQASLDELGGEALAPDIAALADDPDGAKRELAELRAAIEAADGALDTLSGTAAVQRSELEAMRASVGAETAEIAAQEALARVRVYVDRYCRAKLASVLLSREIARYRDENQGPLLAVTSDLFRRLTCNAFVGVRVGYEDGDDATLLCIRDGGGSVDVAGLSEGTRDQLYLALRLASLLRHAELRGPMPFILDDLFVHFDDARACAGFQVLCEVAKKMQVLFFTHHAHLVDLARQVAADQVHVHDLAERGANGGADVALAAS